MPFESIRPVSTLNILKLVHQVGESAISEDSDRVGQGSVRASE